MKRVYVAGPYNADNVIDVLKNVRTGITSSVEAVKGGLSVFCPFLDFHYGLISELSLEDYRRNSIEWVKVSDAILLLPGWENSAGARDELAEASKYGIPAFESINDILRWEYSLDDPEDEEFEQ